jgi:hypothetical protein
MQSAIRSQVCPLRAAIFRNVMKTPEEEEVGHTILPLSDASFLQVVLRKPRIVGIVGIFAEAMKKYGSSCPPKVQAATQSRRPMRTIWNALEV